AVEEARTVARVRGRNVVATGGQGGGADLGDAVAQGNGGPEVGAVDLELHRAGRGAGRGADGGREGDGLAVDRTAPGVVGCQRGGGRGLLGGRGADEANEPRAPIGPRHLAGAVEGEDEDP